VDAPASEVRIGGKLVECGRGVHQPYSTDPLCRDRRSQ